MVRTFIFIVVSLVACSRPAPDSGQVRAHVIDSLKAIYEIQQVEPKATKQATVTAPKTQKKAQINQGDTTYTDKEGNVYPIQYGSKGGAYIERTSKKTGKIYKQYLKTN